MRKLKHRHRLAFLEQTESVRILWVDLADIQRRLSRLPPLAVDDIDRPIDDGQCAQTKKIELYQPAGFNIVFVRDPD